MGAPLNCSHLLSRACACSQCPDASKEDLDLAVSSAKTAFKTCVVHPSTTRMAWMCVMRLRDAYLTSQCVSYTRVRARQGRERKLISDEREVRASARSEKREATRESLSESDARETVCVRACVRGCVNMCVWTGNGRRSVHIALVVPEGLPYLHTPGRRLRLAAQSLGCQTVICGHLVGNSLQFRMCTCMCFS